MKPKEDIPHDLIAAYLAGQASADEVARLEALLRQSPEARKVLRRHARMDAALAASMKPSFAEVTARAVPKQGPRWRTGALLALAASAALFAGAALWWDQLTGVEVRVLSATGEALQHFTPGQEKRLREVETGAGSLQLQLPSGVQMSLAGNSRVGLINPMHAVLKAGSITNDVGSRGKGFVVETANTHVVDLGTRFGVSFQPGGETDVVVLEGKVEVYQPLRKHGATPLLARLQEGEAVRVDRQWMIRRLAAVALDGDALAIVDGPASQPRVVTSVSDNINNADFHRFYSIIPGGMMPGARAYSTLGQPRWQPQENMPFPAPLAGADVVCTFSADRRERGLELTLELARAATVYVMLDTRVPPPQWLREDFTDTGLQLRSGPWTNQKPVEEMPRDADGTVHVNYQVWSRDFPPGPAVLGPPQEKGNASLRVMYGIAVKARE